MVVADQRRLDHVDVLPQVLPVGGDRVALGAELLVVGVGREEVDVGQVRRVALAEVGHQLAQRGKRRRAGLVGDEVAVQGRVVADPGDQGVELLPLRRVVQRRRREQAVLKLRPQAVPLGHVQLLLRAPDEVPAALGHLPGDRVGHRRAGPVGDDRRADLPRGRDSGLGIGGTGRPSDFMDDQQHHDYERCPHKASPVQRPKGSQPARQSIMSPIVA